jgi:hypothetical protein
MLLEKNARFFVKHEMRFRPQRDQGLALPFRSGDNKLDVESILQRAVAKNRADLVVKKQDVVRLIKLDVRLKQNLAVFLFRRSDPDAANPIFENINTRRLRSANKSADEAVAVSAHLFVHLREKAGTAHPTYKAILEEVPGLSRTYIQALISNLLRDSSYKYTDRKGERKDTYCMVDFLGIKSEPLSDALKDSTIPYIELVRPGTISGLDSEGLVVPREERLKLIVKATPEQTPSLLQRIRLWAPTKSWADVRVQVDMPENRSRTVSITREADAADVLFIRAEQVSVKTPLEPCTDTINEELVEKSLELFSRKS